MWIAGFDPGGIDNFGWCAAEAITGRSLVIRATGFTSNASLAVEQVLGALPGGAELSAAGIDSPLCWSATGDRSSDALVRKRVKELGCPSPWGTVQIVNALRGACLVQGALAAHLLREAQPSVRITESHPKALLWLLSVASPERPTRSIGISDLVDHFLSGHIDVTEHERDAALGAYAAWAMMDGRAGWRDLVLDERDPYFPAGAVEYWMPLGVAEPS